MLTVKTTHSNSLTSNVSSLKKLHSRPFTLCPPTQLDSTAQHSTAQHSTAQHSTAQHSTAQHTRPQMTILLGRTSQHSMQTPAPSCTGKLALSLNVRMCDTLAALWRGVTAMRAMMVEQLGLAMIPPCPYRIPFIASGFTSGITKGTPSVILKAELLSTTCSNAIQVCAYLPHDTLSHLCSACAQANPVCACLLLWDVSC